MSGSLQAKHALRLVGRLGLLAALLALCGCVSTAARQQQELLEADLRSQERHIQELKEELDRKEGVIHGLDVEVEQLQRAAASGQPPGRPQLPGIVKEITLGRLTGGYRHDPRATFDDALQVILEPRDTDGSTIKMPGSVHIDLFEITPQGLKSPLSAYDITHRELRRLWDQPLIGGPGYRILLAWKALPATEKLRIVVRFTTLDGKLFEAEKDVAIRLPLGQPRPGLPAGNPGLIQPSPPSAPPPKNLPTRPPGPGPSEVPALPPPPDVPSFGSKRAHQPSMEILPAPRTKDPDAPQAPGEPTPLSAPPPQSWLSQRQPVLPAEYVDEPGIKLHRPIPRSAGRSD